MQEFDKLFCHIVAGHQKEKEVKDAETSICESVSGILTMNEDSQNALKAKAVFH